MNFVLDTNVISEWTKPRPDPGVTNWLADMEEDRITITVSANSMDPPAQIRRSYDGQVSFTCPSANKKGDPRGVAFFIWLRGHATNFGEVT